jgi:lysophospholipase L1-like esterase
VSTLLFAFAVVAANAAEAKRVKWTHGADPQRWQAAIAAFAAADRKAPPPPGADLFVGSSSIRFWHTLAADFPGQPVLNRGFGGAQISDVLHYFDRIVSRYRPRRIIFYCGENDIHANKLPERVALDFLRFVARVHQTLPTVRIYYVTMKPSPSRFALWSKMQATDRLIRLRLLADSLVRVVDIATPMLDPTGKPKADLFTDDRLHLNRRGYDLWRQVITAALAPPQRRSR